LGRPQFYSQAFYDSASAGRGFGPLERGSFMGANIENSDATYPLLSDLKSKAWRIIRLNQHHGTSPRYIGLSAIFHRILRAILA
jgi:hypothetical protein